MGVEDSQVYFYANNRRSGHIGRAIDADGDDLTIRATRPPVFAGQEFTVRRSEVRAFKKIKRRP